MPRPVSLRPRPFPPGTRRISTLCSMRRAKSAPAVTPICSYIFGVDTGTSSTKVVARLPLEPGQPCMPVSAPQHCRSDGHPALWQTVPWMRNSTSSACPGSGARPLHNLKQAAVVESSPSRTPLRSVQPIQAAAAWIGCVIRHAKDWLLSDRSSWFRRRNPGWIVRVGLPAKSCDETHSALLVGEWRSRKCVCPNHRMKPRSRMPLRCRAGTTLFVHRHPTRNLWSKAWQGLQRSPPPRRRPPGPMNGPMACT